MKLKEIAEKIDKSENNSEYVEIYQIAEEIGLECYETTPSDCPIKAYWIGNWSCSGTWVGYKMYFFNDTPVAFSTQPFRKSKEEFKWFGKKEFELVRNYILSLIPESEPNVSYVSIDENIGNYFKVEFNDNVIDWSKGRYDDMPFKHIERVLNEPYGLDTENKIQLPDGSEKIVDISEIDFAFNLA